MRKHLATYARDSGDGLYETREARKWLQDVDANLAGPMARAHGKDYFVNELAMANIPALGGTVPVIIQRWYEKDAKLVANVHPVGLTPDRTKFLVDARRSSGQEVALEAFVMSVEEMNTGEVQALYGIPPPASIAGTSALLARTI